MQTTSTLPIQVQGASPAKSSSNAPTGAADQFQQTLSRQMESQQAARNAAPPAKPADKAPEPPAQPNQAAQPSAPADKTPDKAADAAPPAKDGGSAGDKRADASTAAKADGDDDARSAPADPATLPPVADMLALVASFNLPPQAVPKAASSAQPAESAKTAAAPLGAAGTLAPVLAGAAPQAADPQAAAGFGDALADAATNRLPAAVAVAPQAATDSAAAVAAPTLPAAPALAAVAGKSVPLPGKAERSAPVDAAPAPAIKHNADPALAAVAAAPAAAPLAAPVAADGDSKPLATGSVVADASAAGSKPATSASAALLNDKPAAAATSAAPAPAAPAGAPQADAAQLAAAKPRATDAPVPKDVIVVTPPVAPLVREVAASAVQAAASIPADRLAGRVGSPAWDQQLGQKIVWMVAGGEQSASLTLNPPDLGPLQVVLNVNNDQASATFTSAQPEVRQALEAAMPKLRDMMSEAGITLGSATVGTGMPNQQNGGNEQARFSAGGQGQSGARGGSGGGSDEALPGAAVRSAPRSSANRGVVDTFA